MRRRPSTRLVTAGLVSEIRTRTTSYKLEVNTRRLDKLPVAVNLKVRDAVSQTTTDIQGEAQQNIRDLDLIDTGNLLNSITASTSMDGMTGYVDVGAFYGIYHEFGTVKMAARPFLGPAVSVLTSEFIRSVRQAVREGIESV